MWIGVDGVDGCGWVWMGVDGCGWVCVGVAVVWMGVDGCGGVNMCVDGYGGG